MSIAPDSKAPCDLCSLPVGIKPFLLESAATLWQGLRCYLVMYRLMV